jgi:hypothetical protein
MEAWRRAGLAAIAGALLAGPLAQSAMRAPERASVALPTHFAWPSDPALEARVVREALGISGTASHAPQQAAPAPLAADAIEALRTAWHAPAIAASPPPIALPEPWLAPLAIAFATARAARACRRRAR